MSKVLIFKEDQRYKEFVKKIKEIEPELDKLYAELKKWDFIDVELSDLKALIEKSIKIQGPTLSVIPGKSPDYTGFDREIEEVVDSFARESRASNVLNPKIEGIPISKAKLIEIIEVPPIPQALLKQLERVSNLLNSSFNSIPKFEFFKIEDNGIVLNAEQLARFEQECCYYAETEEEIALTKTIQVLCDSLNQFKEKIKRISEIEGEKTFKHPSVFIKNGVFYPHHSFIKTHAKSFQS